MTKTYIKDFSKVKFQTQIGDVNVKYLVNGHFGEYVKYPDTDNDEKRPMTAVQPCICIKTLHIMKKRLKASPIRRKEQ
jgi:hypothetical protein